jgi:hypothetical protein
MTGPCGREEALLSPGMKPADLSDLVTARGEEEPGPRRFGSPHDRCVPGVGLGPHPGCRSAGRTGVVVEVYPAVTLQQWGLPHRGYKGPGNTSKLASLVDAVLAAAPWLDLGTAEPECRRRDDALDAVIAALAARAAMLGLVTLPSTEQAELAKPGCSGGGVWASCRRVSQAPTTSRLLAE